MTFTRTYIEDLIYGRKKSVLAGCLLGLLSGLYGFLVVVRTYLYAAGIFRRRKVGQRVISVGNITLGGTGKTPAVISIARVLRNKGIPCAVVSRGYGRHDENEVVAVSDGHTVLVDSRTGGDEPVLIAYSLPDVPVVVGRDRHAAASVAVNSFGSRVILLDDGFQHRRLDRDLDIVLIDAADPFGRGRLFPAGILREPLSALKRAHAVLITGADGVQDLEPLRSAIRSRTEARIFTSRRVPVELLHSGNGERKPLSALRGSTVLAIAGIARPKAFLSMLRSLGANIKSEFLFPDHYAYKKSDLAGFFQKAADANISMIVTTEKDAVRLKGLLSEGIWALRIALQVDEPEAWETLLTGSI